MPALNFATQHVGMCQVVV